MNKYASIINDLCETVGRLSASAEEQAAYVIQLGVAPLVDELALEFGDVVVRVPELVAAGVLNESQATVLQELHQTLHEFSGIENEELWLIESLGDPIWAMVRALANKARVSLGCE